MWYQSLKFSFVREKTSIMPRRRHRDKPVANPSVEEEMRRLCARIYSMETAQRREPHAGDISEAESGEMEVEGAVGEDVAKECLLRVVVKMGAREKMEIPMYEVNLDVEELLDWIREMDKYFNYEEVDDEKKVNHAITTLKGHATLWCDELQDDTRRKGKKKLRDGT
jgi:hypothetical protein